MKSRRLVFSLVQSLSLLLVLGCSSHKDTQVSAPDPMIGVWVTGWYETMAAAKQMERQSYEFFPDGTVRYEWQSDVPSTRRSRGFTYRFEGTYTVDPPKEHAVTEQRNLDITKKKEMVRYAPSEANAAAGNYGLPEILPNKFYDITGLMYDGTRDEKLLKFAGVIRVDGNNLYSSYTPALFYRDDYPTEREPYVLVEPVFRKQ